MVSLNPLVYHGLPSSNHFSIMSIFSYTMLYPFFRQRQLKILWPARNTWGILRFPPQRKFQWPEINPLGFAKVCQHIPRLKQLPDIGKWCSLHFLTGPSCNSWVVDECLHPRPKQLTVGKGISNEELQKNMSSAGSYASFGGYPKTCSVDTNEEK